MRNEVAIASLLIGGVAAGVLLRRAVVMATPGATSRAPWNQQAAAHYLDSREIWWQHWPRAQKDHGTVCISCHTQVPYAMVRPELQRELGETGTSIPEEIMMTSVEVRVANWSEMVPFYSDAKNGPGKTAQARATEAVLNAVILSFADAAQGHLRQITRAAFSEAWALQDETGDRAGAWNWQDFHLGPWESVESGYQGAALLMVAALNAPEGYAAEADTQHHLERLRRYLQRHYAAQPAVNKLYVLWSSAKDPTLMTGAERNDLLASLQNGQQADGGWRTSAMDETRRSDKSPEPTGSDGYATGLAVLAMEESGVSPHDPILKRGLAWLTGHQDKDGTWTAASINKKRDPASDPGLFMTDASTGYAVLALQKQRQ